MKKNTAFLFTLLGLAIAFQFQACNPDKPPTTPIDEEFPTITMTTPVEMPLGSYNYYDSDDSIHIDIRFDDDVELDRYEVTIRYARDLYYLKAENFPWSVTYYGALEGQSGGFNHVEYVVYDPSAGPYEFNVKVWDKVGNLTTTTTWLFITNLQDTHVPVVNITIPISTSVDTFTIGQDMQVKATMSDLGGLITSGRMRLRNPITHEMLPGSEIIYDSIWAQPYTMDTFFTIQAGSIPGDYLVEVYANDPVYNTGMDTVRVFIKPQ